MRSVFVTGADGFVGLATCRQLASRGYFVRAGVRTRSGVEKLRSGGFTIDQVVILGDIDRAEVRPEVFHGCEAVIHLAARVHVMNETAQDPLKEFRRVNVEGTRRLAEAAIAAGVRRFVFTSSIKVNGEYTRGEAFSETTELHPQDSYGISKHEAEQWLLNTASKAGLEVAIIRPPLVYGPGVSGNLFRLMRHLHRHLPLVLPPEDNRRSMIDVRNIADLLTTCVEHPNAVNQVFLASDGQDLSTRDVVRILASACGKTAVVLTVPKLLITLGSSVAPFHNRLRRLTESLQVDSSKARCVLGWKPSVRPEAGLASAAHWFLSTLNK